MAVKRVIAVLSSHEQDVGVGAGDVTTRWKWCCPAHLEAQGQGGWRVFLAMRFPRMVAPSPLARSSLQQNTPVRLKTGRFLSPLLVVRGKLAKLRLKQAGEQARTGAQ